MVNEKAPLQKSDFHSDPMEAWSNHNFRVIFWKLRKFASAIDVIRFLLSCSLLVEKWAQSQATFFFQKTRKTVNFGTFYRFCDIWKISWVRNVRYRPNISFIPFLWSNISFFEVLNSQSKSVNPQFPIKLKLLKIGIFSKVCLI